LPSGDGFSDSHRLSTQDEPIDIEGLRHDRRAAIEDEMPGRDVVRSHRAVHELNGLAPIQ
jgi:hypothetical protein